ncbi:HAMP domain-containing protein [Streptomyces sp. DvalAA-14]|uniref:HAMP domain-containing protein n=1 Tax=unclassified Streptomyces TaxID=2593676 RepID=UPI00081B76C7|nr:MULTISPECIES: HAMP domain-containing protein [unclassified Streptomyces]MYS20938.1 HAMP domain-containing protein [Streptomyces sp. SID4948]SCD80391.1 HAMP domain-containing protein [Streptomyces sp. DvalAA-14]
MSLLGGIRPPIAALAAALLALAGVTALTIGQVHSSGQPAAVLTSQQHFAEDGAIALRASLDESVTDLDRTAELFDAGPPVGADAVLDKIGNVYQKWLGTAVIEIGSGRLLAARGENVPLTAIDRASLGDENGLAPRMVKLTNGETRLLTFGLLSWPGKPQQLLIASSSLKFPGISLGDFRAIAVLDPQGEILSEDGIPTPEQVLTDDDRKDVAYSTAQLAGFAKAVVRQTAKEPLTTKDPGAGGFLGVSGNLQGGVHDGERTIAGYATLTGPQPGEGTVATGLGLSVVAMVGVAEDPTRSDHPLFGVLAAGALLLIGALAVAVLLGTVQRPLLKLFLESRRLHRGDLTRPVNAPGYGETARIGRALEALRRQLRGDDLGPPERAAGQAAPPARRIPRVGSRGVVALCAILLLTWAAPLLLLFNRADATAIIPQQIVNDQRERTDTLTDRVRRALNEGQADLSSVASLIGDKTPEKEMTTVLDHTLGDHDRYKSLYVLTPGGRVLARSGDKPRELDRQKPRDLRVAVVNTGGREPVIAGYAEIPGRDGAVLVGEFRIEFLNSLLKRPGLGTIRVVDAHQRVIAGNTGYRAFQRLPSADLDELVEASALKVGTSAHPGSVVFRRHGRAQIAASAPFVGGGPAKSLGWSVVSWQPAAALDIPEYRLQHRTTLAGLLGLAAAAACLGWLHIVVVRPLRDLAAQAEALAGGDRRTVLFPRHHDEVGAVTRSLELIRQRLQEQRKNPAAEPAGRN